uniref:DDE-1 domain-containing protein n=1 Tax=Trichogramma kaykai TaxID=54128 RepID=A0ABD2WKN8_9HYME
MLLNKVEEIVVKLNRKNPFKDNKPGRHWFDAFCRRHDNISTRICQNLTTSRLSATETALRGWFKEVDNHIDPLKLKNINPNRIYNLDESAFFLIPKGEKVLARKGSKAVYKVVHGDDKESLTVLFTVAANGVILPPMILFWYERIPSSIARNLPREWIAGTTEKGWMTADCFFKYISGQFYPWLIKNKIEFPVILYVDGHSSYITLELCQFCREHKIEVIALYPNATHIIQPLDVSVFSPLKKQYRKQVDSFRLQNNGERMARHNFAQVLKDCLDSIENLPQMIKNGFAITGLFPFSPDSVDYNILNKMPKSIKNSFIAKNLPSQEDSLME